MYLLQLEGNDDVSLARYEGDDVPQYAILSHTWASDNEEVSYQDLMDATWAKNADDGDSGRGKPGRSGMNATKTKLGYKKILFCGRQAARDNLRYFWVDTCCINKTSSAELTESINSMFRWYLNASKCYVYLSDVSVVADFNKSRWFGRGWTLQELLAPPVVEFFSKDKRHLGDKESLEGIIQEVTGIAAEALRGQPLSEFGVDERLDWAKHRSTKREEDRAYSLLGIFRVFMPLLYGEGFESAMKRLRKEIEESRREAAKQQEALLDALRFEQIDTRQMTIRDAHSNTCVWLLNKTEYRKWLDPTELDQHHGFLWIKGKPGTGKSTIMKYAHYQARRTVESVIRGNTYKNTKCFKHYSTSKSVQAGLVIAFYFNARGQVIEKSTLGMYRSLLLQLFERSPPLWRRVLNYLDLKEFKLRPETELKVEVLQEFLKAAILSMKEPVICFIDALDECEEEQVRNMISFFEHVCQLAMSAGVQIRICFASRHYPHVSIKKGLELVLEGQEGHSQDITEYLQSELRIGQSKIAQQVRLDVQSKASGIFMWVVLVVGILNKEYDSGRIHALRQRLQEIPSDLNELFLDIMTRDARNTDELILCIQWVLFATQPLSPEQLYFAILSGVAPDALAEWDREEITSDTMKRFILDSSKGLVEFTISDTPKAQFIHESVRDFLLKSDGLRQIWPGLGTDFPSLSHRRLNRGCIYYMSSSILPQPVDLMKLQHPIKDRLPNAANFGVSALSDWPFLEYAIENVLHHADAAGEHDTTRNISVQILPLIRCIAFETSPDEHTKNKSMFYVLTEYDMSSDMCFACVVNKGKGTARVFFKNVTPNGFESAHLPSAVGSNSAPDLRRKRGRVVLSRITGLEDRRMFALLGTGITDVNVDEGAKQTPQSSAKEGGYDAIVKLLREIRTDINTHCERFGNVLHVASAEGFERVVSLLVDSGAEINAQGGRYGNALQAAVVKGSVRIVLLLLDKGADVNAEGGRYGNSLYAASAKGHANIAKLLLDYGANVNARGGHYGNALQAAIRNGHTLLVELLQESGAIAE